VIVAIIGAIATVAAAYIGNRGGFTAILPGSPVKTVTVTKEAVASPEVSDQPTQSASTGGGGGTAGFPNTYLSTLTPVENSTSESITPGPVTMSNETFQNSLSTLCLAEPPGARAVVAYDISGASFLNTTIGIPDDAPNTVGDTITITFFKNGLSEQLAAPINVSVGQPQAIHLNLEGATQLDFTCTAVNATQGTVSSDFALGDAQLTGP